LADTQQGAIALPGVHVLTSPAALQLQTPHSHVQPQPQSVAELHAVLSTKVQAGNGVVLVMGVPGLGGHVSGMPPPSYVGESGEGGGPTLVSTPAASPTGVEGRSGLASGEVSTTWPPQATPREKESAASAEWKNARHRGFRTVVARARLMLTTRTGIL
jgi:hypothetical protein